GTWWRRWRRSRSTRRRTWSAALHHVADQAELAVHRAQGQLVPQPGVDAGQRLLVEVDVVAVELGGFDGLGDGRGDVGGGDAGGQGGLEGVLELDLAGPESRGGDVRDVIRGHPLAQRQTGEGDL